MTLYCHNCGEVLQPWELNDGKCPVCESGDVHPLRNPIDRMKEKKA